MKTVNVSFVMFGQAQLIGGSSDLYCILLCVVICSWKVMLHSEVGSLVQVVDEFMYGFVERPQTAWFVAVLGWWNNSRGWCASWSVTRWSSDCRCLVGRNEAVLMEECCCLSLNVEWWFCVVG